MTIHMDSEALEPTAGWLLLTPAEAAEALRVGRSIIYELIAEKRLESVEIGRSRRIPRAALEAFVAELRSGAR